MKNTKQIAIIVLVSLVVTALVIWFVATSLYRQSPNAGGEASVTPQALAPVAPLPRAPDSIYHDNLLGFRVNFPNEWKAEESTHTLALPIARIRFSSLKKNEKTFDEIANEINITPSFKRLVSVGIYQGTLIACGGIESGECILIDQGATILKIELNRIGLITSDAEIEVTEAVRKDIKTILASFTFDTHR